MQSKNAQWAEANWDIIANHLAQQYPQEVHEALVGNGWMDPIDDIIMPEAFPGTMAAHLIALAPMSEHGPSEFIGELALSILGN